MESNPREKGMEHQGRVRFDHMMRKSKEGLISSCEGIAFDLLFFHFVLFFCVCDFVDLDMPSLWVQMDTIAMLTNLYNVRNIC